VDDPILADGTEHVKHKTAAGLRGVDCLDKRLDPDATLFEKGETVQLPDHDDIARVLACAIERTLQLRPITLSAGSLLGKDAITAGSLQGVKLEDRSLILCGYLRVADQHSASQ
jgi:hypothetical protein